VVVDADVCQAEQLTPQRADLAFEVVARRGVRGAKGGPRVAFAATLDFAHFVEHRRRREVFETGRQFAEVLGRDHDLWQTAGQRTLQGVEAIFEADAKALASGDAVGARLGRIAFQARLPGIPLPLAPVNRQRAAVRRAVPPSHGV